MSNLAQPTPVADDQAARENISSDGEGEVAENPSSSKSSSLQKDSNMDCSKQPWGRFAVLWCLCALATGVAPGGALWIKLYADAGMGSFFCDGGDGDGQGGDTCKAQYVALTGVFAIGGTCMAPFNVIIGLMYDRWGIQKVGAGGMALCVLGLLLMAFSVLSSESGQGGAAMSILTVGLIVADFGSMLNTYGLLGMVYFFPGRQTLVITLVGITYQVAAFLPLIIVGLVGTTGADLLHALLVYAAAVAVLTPVCWRLCPTPKEYCDQAELVLGTRLPDPPKGCPLCSMLKGAWQVMKQHLCDHTVSLLTYMLGGAFPLLYSSMAVPYGEALFKQQGAGTELAAMYVTVNGFAGLIIAPAMGQAGDKFGLWVFILCMGVGTAVSTMTCGVARWPAQLVCQVGLVVYNTLLTPVVQRYIICYAPPNRLGACQAFYWAMYTLCQLPMMPTALAVVGLLPPGVNAYRMPMLGFGILGTLTMGLYGLYFRSNPPPKQPIELDDDRQDDTAAEAGGGEGAAPAQGEAA